MKTAILYSGQARTFASCWPNQWWMVLRRYPNADVFAAVADDEQAPSMSLLADKFPKDQVHIEVSKQPDFPMAEAMARNNAHGGYGISAHPQNIMRAFWGYKQVWEMLPGVYERYIRIRPDLWFQEFEAPPKPEVHECLTPAWGSYGGVNDRFAIMGARAAENYMTAFDRIGELIGAGCPYHPETLTRAAIENEGACMVSQTLKTEFKIRRMADPRSPYLEKRVEWLVPEPTLGYELMRASL